MDPETKKILDEMFIDIEWMNETLCTALNQSGLCKTDSLISKHCQQSVDFYEIFESHMFYAELKPDMNAEYEVKKRRFLTCCVKVFYAGMYSVLQERKTGKKIEEFNNPEFDSILRYRVKYDTISSIMGNEFPLTDEEEKKISNFFYLADTALSGKYALDKCLQSYNTGRVFSPYFDAGVTYAKTK